MLQLVGEVGKLAATSTDAEGCYLVSPKVSIPNLDDKLTLIAHGM